MEERKCVVHSEVGVDSAQATCAISGRNVGIVVDCGRWEVGLVKGVKRLQRDWWSLKGRRF